MSGRTQAACFQQRQPVLLVLPEWHCCGDVCGWHATVHVIRYGFATAAAAACLDPCMCWGTLPVGQPADATCSVGTVAAYGCATSQLTKDAVVAWAYSTWIVGA